MRATAPDRLLVDANQVVGKRFSASIVDRGAVPGFIPKHNSALIGNRVPTAGDAAGLEIGETEGGCRAGQRALRSHFLGHRPAGRA